MDESLLDVRTMAREMIELKRELEMLKLQHAIDTIQREIDTTTAQLKTSTPVSQSNPRHVVFDGTDVSEVRQSTSLITPYVSIPHKPRRLLPKIPLEDRTLDRTENNTKQLKCRSDEPACSDIAQQGTANKDSPSIQHSNTPDGIERPKGTFMKPATYDGLSSWSDYRAHFDACAALNGWDSTQKGLYLSVSLRGQAQSVFGNLGSGQTNFEALTQALEERFAPPNQTELYRVQLRERQQRATESMAELGQDIRRLTNLAYASAPSDVRETLAKEQFLDALVNPDMRLRIKQSRPKDLNDAVRHAVELESFYRAERRQQGMVRSTTAGAETSNSDIQGLKHVQSSFERYGPAQTSQTGNTPNNGGYHGPGQPSNWNQNQRPAMGANAYTTPPPNVQTRPMVKCYECGLEGHIRRNCPVFQQRLPHMFKKSGLIDSAGLYAKAKLDGVPVDCLVDTGASLTLVSKSLWEQIQHKHTLSVFETPILSASGDRMKIVGKTDILLEFENICCPQQVVIAEMEIDIVLGIDFMKSHHVCLDVIQNTMTVQNSTFSLSCVGKVGCYRVVLVEKIEVPPESEKLTFGRVNDQGICRIGLGLVEPSERFIDLGKGLVARALVQAGENVPIRIANLSRETRTYYPGTNVATLSPITRVEEKSIVESKYNCLPAHMIDLYDRTCLGMDETQRRDVRTLLQKYAHLFSKDDNDIGNTNIIKHHIPTGEARPIKQPARRVPFHMQKEVDDELNRMLEKGIIQPSKSPWASGIVLVRKKDGTCRFCIDYRKLNDVTTKDAYPLPRIDESLDQLSGSAWFSCLDLSSGYWQVGVAESDKPKTAFATKGGLFEFNFMPFGLCNAPATFERLMEYVLAGLHWNICLVYLDDIIVIGKDFHDMTNNLEAVFQRFESAGLKLKPRKCQLFKKEVEFLGHVVSEHGVSTDPKKIECIEKWPIPKNPTEVRSFLGLCGYYRRFIKNYSHVAKPLHSLTEKNRKFDWTKECNHAFLTLKQMLTQTPVLSHPDFTQSFILDTDASNNAIGAVLSQNISGTEKVIAYASRTLSKSEKHYCVTRKEMLALVFFVKYFKHYLYGRKFLVRTDHGSLRWLMNFKNPEGQVARWIETLSSYDMNIEHRAGRKHGNADGVSRIPCRQCGIESAEWSEELPQPIATIHSIIQSELDLKKTQQQDKDICQVIDWVKSNTKPQFKDIASSGYFVKALWNQFEILELKDGLLVRKWKDEITNQHINQVIVPRDCRRRILLYAHDVKTAGHLGIKKTLIKIRQQYYWPGIQQDVRIYVAGCEICMKRKGPMQSKQAPMQIVRSGYPMERIAIDILGELPETENGHKYILVIADYFTKWTECFPMRDMEAATVARILVEQVISRFGVPSQIHSDQGRQFESRLFQEMCEILNIDKTRTTPYHPQSDGMVERFNRTLTTMISAYVNEHHRDWDAQIPYIMMAYRSSEHETTNMTPNMLMLGREVCTPLDLAFEVPTAIKTFPAHQWVWELRERLEIAHSMVRKNTERSMHRQKQIHDRKLSYETFQPGDKVYVYFPVKKIGNSSKFTSFWRGPYTVLQKVSNVLFKIDCDRNKQGQVIHCDRVRRCKNQMLLGEDDSRETQNVESQGVEVSDDNVVEDAEQDEFCGRRIRRKPTWAKDYVFSTFRVDDMPLTKTTERKQPPGICPCCLECISGDFAQHVKTCPKRLACQWCKKTFLKPAYLRKHNSDVHGHMEGTSEPAPGTSKASPASTESWDSDPDIELEAGPDPVQDLTAGRVFRMPTRPSLPAAPKRALEKTDVGTDTRDNPRQKRKLSVETEGELSLDLGSILGRDTQLLAGNIKIKAEGGKLRVDVEY